MDPVELGGDGKPGFDCPKCNQRTRILDFLDPVKADSDDRYCHAAISTPSELEIAKSKGEHCKIFSVGPTIFTISSGIPVSPEKRTVLASLFRKLQNDGAYEKIMNENRPISHCFEGDGSSGPSTTLNQLTITDMIGLWIFVLGFGVAGVMVSMFSSQRKGVKPRIHRISHYVKKMTVGAESNKPSAAEDRSDDFLVGDRDHRPPTRCPDDDSQAMCLSAS